MTKVEVADMIIVMGMNIAKEIITFLCLKTQEATRSSNTMEINLRMKKVVRKTKLHQMYVIPLEVTIIRHTPNVPPNICWKFINGPSKTKENK
ncbi:hypothetical protein Hanom_Chr07g00597981 [Helianthus anomalus]